jgi:ribosome-binding protein aMBF1 (putative translation factor)
MAERELEKQLKLDWAKEIITLEKPRLWNLIKAHRIILGLSPADVAKAIGMNVRDYRSHERGNSKQGIARLHAIEDALRLPTLERKRMFAIYSKMHLRLTNNQPIPTPFGMQVTKQRELIGLTAAQLAKKIGTIEEYIISWEEGTLTPSPKDAKKLKDALVTPAAEAIDAAVKEVKRVAKGGNGGK